MLPRAESGVAVSSTLREVIDERREKCDALEAALALYPDAYIQGDCLFSDSLKPEDCDYAFVEHTKDGDLLRAGKQLKGTVVCRRFSGSVPFVLVWDLCRKEPELYKKLVQLVAKR